MNVKVRLIVVVILLLSVILEVADLVYKISWNLIPDWDKMLTLFGIVVELCGTLLAYWAYEDRVNIEELKETAKTQKP